ncbi:MAG TPA: class I SAM-dependent methyltransferase, partial [Gemmataceae bacterium]|nr:class I SAM-dependent methyltransferase [Gemmataceae bacterium]
MGSGPQTVGPRPLRLNLGGEGEEPDCINQQPSWVDLSFPIARSGQPLSSLSQAGVPFLFCDNRTLPFPDETVDEIMTNGVPIDLGMTWLGPSLESGEIRRVLKSGGRWFDN